MAMLWFVVITAVICLQAEVISCEDDIKAGRANMDLVDLVNRMNEFEKRENKREIEMKEMQMKIETLETENYLLKTGIARLKDTVNDCVPEPIGNEKDSFVLQTENDHEHDEVEELNKPGNGEIRQTKMIVKNVNGMLGTFGSRVKSTGGIVKKTRVYSDSGDQGMKKNDVRRVNGADTELGVSFYAVLSQNLLHSGVNQTVIFDKVYTNIGNAYSKHAGDFRAPVAGIYVFSTTLMAHNSHTTQYHIVKNGAQVGNLYLNGSSSPYITGSLTIVLFLNIGDEVAIKNLYADENLNGLEYSTFSGFLLQRGSTPTNIVG